MARRVISRRFLPPDPRVEEPYRLTPKLALRVGLLGMVAIAVFATLFLRLWSLQILNGQQLLRAAQNNQRRDVRVPAPRGSIVDRVTKDKQVAEGDVIVTAGTRSKQYPSLFPADIPIGWVTSVGQSDTAPYKQIQIQPYVDFSSLDAVTALITSKRSPRAP